MLQFKKGDKVICLQSSKDKCFLLNHIYVVREDTIPDPYVVEIKLDSKGRTHNGWFANFFKLAEPKYKRNLPSWW